jgi:hypothetical protein
MARKVCAQDRDEISQFITRKKYVSLPVLVCHQAWRRRPCELAQPL